MTPSLHITHLSTTPLECLDDAIGRSSIPNYLSWYLNFRPNMSVSSPAQSLAGRYAIPRLTHNAADFFFRGLTEQDVRHGYELMVTRPTFVYLQWRERGCPESATMNRSSQLLPG